VNLRGVASLVLLVTIVTAGALSAQDRSKWLVAGMFGFSNVTQKTALDTTKASGTLIGLEAGYRFWRAELRGRYSQGGLSPDGGGESIDLVEGELMLGVWPVDMLELQFGPRARSYVTGAGTVRWVFWEVRARFETSLSRNSTLWSYFEGWYVLSGSVNAAGSFGNGRGLEGGIGLMIPSTPLRARLGYRIDQGALQEGSRTEAIEELILAVGIGR
jgi:hypothetical protein